MVTLKLNEDIQSLTAQSSRFLIQTLGFQMSAPTIFEVSFRTGAPGETNACQRSLSFFCRSQK